MIAKAVKLEALDKVLIRSYFTCTVVAQCTLVLSSLNLKVGIVMIRWHKIESY